MGSAKKRRNEPPYPDTPIIRVFRPDQPPADDEQRLRQFFESWFLPEVLDAERDSSDGTIRAYRESLRWWEALTSDPPLRAIDRETLKDFRAKLRTATYARSARKDAPRYPLSKARQLIILRNIRAILFRAGPDLDPRRPAAGIIAKPAHIPVERIASRPKPGYSLKRAQMIAEACDRMTDPVIVGISAGAWCYALVCAFFFTGLRRETVRLMQWSWFHDREDGIWMEVPDDAVPKTEKGTHVFVHPELWLALKQIRTGSAYCFSIDRVITRKRRGPKGWYMPQVSGDRINRLMYRLQTVAGIPKAQQLSVQAWRRTHMDQLDDVGYAAVRRVVQEAADHADAETTEASYVDLKNKYRRRLPWLRAPRDRQRHLFE